MNQLSFHSYWKHVQTYDTYYTSFNFMLDPIICNKLEILNSQR